jgi:segregation and condensation protein A
MQTYKLEQFEGPLDLLLQMIHKEELDISEIALATMAEQFVLYIQENPDGISGEELTDFLLVATQLLLLKSQLLLPNVQIEDEISPDALETQLKLYRRFVDIAKALQTKINQHDFLYKQSKSRFEIKPAFSPPTEVKVEEMQVIMEAVIKRLEPIVILPESVMEKTVTLHEKMLHIQTLIKSSKGVSFRQMLDASENKIEKIVSFLALLELVKQQEVSVKQIQPFEDILINRNQAES